jgi:hypothetical protein
MDPSRYRRSVPGGDMMIVRFTPNAAFLMRTWKLADISSADDWVSTATASQLVARP